MSDTEPTIQLTASVVLFAAKMRLGQQKKRSRTNAKCMMNSLMSWAISSELQL